SVVSMFNEDVEKWLNQAEIRYTPSVTFKGKSGYDQFFDFVVPASKQAPERIIKTVNRPTKDKAQNLVFAWIDIKEVRKPDSRAYAVLNDTDYPISPGILDALHKYDIEPLKWSLREEMQAELVK
ncbi:MAG: DUF1829 domain-containing protein, partial [Armatimonadetes bacterium]|nr:DUF1829 domain-containing protein [Armatimonadota bacterium]